MGTFLGDPDNWTHLDTDYTGFLTLAAGADSNYDRNQCAQAIINMSTRSPVCLALILTGNPDNIHVVHLPSFYPGNPTATMIYDDRVVVLMGNDLQASVPLVLPPQAFERTAATRCYNTDFIIGVMGMGQRLLFSELGLTMLVSVTPVRSVSTRPCC